MSKRKVARPIIVTVTPEHVKRAYHSYERPWTRHRGAYCPIQIAIAEHLKTAISTVSVDQQEVVIRETDKEDFWYTRKRYYEPDATAIAFMNNFDDDVFKSAPPTEPVTLVLKRDLETENYY